MGNPQSTIAGILDSPILWGIITLVTLGIGFSGKLSVTGTKVCLVLAWAMAAWAIYRFPIVQQLAPTGRLMATMCAAGAFGLGLHLLFVWSEPVRDLDTAELANTTKCQEAMIINKYKNAIFSKEAEPECESYFSDRYELIARGILQCSRRISSRSASKSNLPKGTDPNAQYDEISQCFLTQKGKRLAEDLLYLREHPKIIVARPMESQPDFIKRPSPTPNTEASPP